MTTSLFRLFGYQCTTLLLLSILLTAATRSCQSFSTGVYSAAFLSSRRNNCPLRDTKKSALFLSPSVVVVSPPGGVGECAAVECAKSGASVRWFVVSSPPQAGATAFSSSILEAIDESGGQLELAGSTVDELLGSSSYESLSSVCAWCANAEALIATLDGINIEKKKGKNQEALLEAKSWKNAIKIAAKQASQSMVAGRTKIAILSADSSEDQADGDDQNDSGIFGIFKKESNIPTTLIEAISGNDDDVITLRHGSIFGIPESSPDFSPFLGGPRKVPELCEEYLLRSVRLEPSSLFVSDANTGSVTKTSSLRSSRHAIGELAALLSTQKLEAITNGVDIGVSSLPGNDKPTLADWETEWSRVMKSVLAKKSSSTSQSALELFEVEFANVPDVSRLADWLAEKWAPAVLRTYDIAAIRVGARPVFARRIQKSSTVEIVWQELQNFESVVVGRMIIQVTPNGITAVRGPGDSQKGMSQPPAKPLAGEDVLIRRLADAAAQAAEKGLAIKKVRAIVLYFCAIETYFERTKLRECSSEFSPIKLLTVLVFRWLCRRHPSLKLLKLPGKW